MSQLRPCGECHRHVRIDETTCPFCSASLASATARPLPNGRLTRAAVFAGAALVGAAGAACGGSQPKAETPPPPPATADAGFAQEPPPSPPDAGVPVKPDPDRNMPMPYGAPPARTRLV